jgi:hypothetical protein
LDDVAANKQKKRWQVAWIHETKQQLTFLDIVPFPLVFYAFALLGGSHTYALSVLGFVAGCLRAGGGCGGAGDEQEIFPAYYFLLIVLEMRGERAL